MTAAIHEFGQNNHGDTVSSGFHAVGPNGQLVKLPPGTKLKSGWSLATESDLEAAAAVEAKRRSKGKGANEHEDRERQAARAAAKRAAVESAGRTLTVSDEDLAKSHERGDNPTT